MPTSTDSHDDNKVIDFLSKKSIAVKHQEQILRLSPEHDGLCMLYSNNHAGNGKLFSMRLLCWALNKAGQVEGLVPWLNKVLCCSELNDQEKGQWQGYYNPANGEVFYKAPEHKTLELQHAQRYFSQQSYPDGCVQEIPDTIGTHAMMDAEQKNSLVLAEVLSWRLMQDGQINAMVIDENKMEGTPVLPGDPCLYPAQTSSQFRYYFQHHIANQIKAHDPEALAAVALLFDH